MDKSEVIQHFCELASTVGEVKFRHKIPHDCFCKDSHCSFGSFQFDEEVLQFIKDAVNEKMNKERSNEL